MGGNVGLVDIAKNGISTQLILWPDDHRQNVWRQYLWTTHMEFDVKGKKLWSNRSDATENNLALFKFSPVWRTGSAKNANNFATILKERRFCRARKQAKRLSMGNKHFQRSTGVLLFKFSCHVSTSNHQIKLYWDVQVFYFVLWFSFFFRMFNNVIPKVAILISELTVFTYDIYIFNFV